ncbi:MAG: AarF/ABC1/UbiB kinase family protein [Alphaproteobacteria bacterium]|nr:AarF/ABC1/UbiB kinase family protein [Alphaproteobacteria bacterium]
MDDLSPLKQMARYGKTTTTLGGMAVRLIGNQYLNTSLNHDAYAHVLVNTLGQLKGPLMKVAQFLATIPNALPQEYAQTLLSLQSHAPAMGVPFVKRRMHAELGADWEKRFKAFDLTARFAASLGQVHQAESHQGEVLACKLQYPGMDHLVSADLNQLKIIFQLYEQFNSAIKTADIHQEIQDRLLEELDYVNEAQNLRRYAEFFQGHDNIKVPAVYEELSTKRLLTLSWVEGESIFQKLEHPQGYRDKLGELLFQAWYLPFYQKGMIHADPHPGNYRITQDDPIHLTLLDFGCVRYFSSQFIEGVKNLYVGLKENDQERMVHAYTQWGFQNLTHNVIEAITQWARLLYDPLLDDQVRPIQTVQGDVGWKVAQNVHKTLNEEGGLRPPREFVFMDRASVGIGSVIMRLDARQNWHRLFEEMIVKS